MLRLSAFSRAPRRAYATVVEHGAYKIAASGAGQATASISLVLKAGTRYQSKPGVAHVFKNFAFKNTQTRSALATVRETELYGGVLSSSLGREQVAITAEFLKGDEEFFASLLASLLGTHFTNHELHESVIPSVLSETLSATGSSKTVAIETAHSLAFRSGLATPLFAPEKDSASINIEDVRQFARQVYTSPAGVAVVGTGIEPDVLQSLVEKHFPPINTTSSSNPSTKTSFHTGESRIPSSISSAHSTTDSQTVFIGFAAPPGPELSLLNAHLSPIPSLKWGASTSPLSTSTSTSVETVLLPYSDATLFGILIASHSASDLKQSATHAVASLKALSSTDGIKQEELQKAAAKAKFSALVELDTRDGFVNGVGRDLLSNTTPSSAAQQLEALEKVTASQLSKYTSNLLKGSTKPIYVAVGDTGVLPWADEIGL